MFDSFFWFIVICGLMVWVVKKAITDLGGGDTRKGVDRAITAGKIVRGLFRK